MLNEDFIFTEEDLKNAKSRELLPCKCNSCGKIFYRAKNKILSIIKLDLKHMFCSIKCSHNKDYLKHIIHCEHCGKIIKISNSHYIKVKNHFCSKSCATKYKNAHKTSGYRRSKLEIYLETKLYELFPNLEIVYNDRNTLGTGLELDIYVPSLKLAFELNGPFHYIPVFGQEKFDKIQNNDFRKLHMCQQLGINLCIIDTSHQKRFTEKSSEKFLEIIKFFILR